MPIYEYRCGGCGHEFEEWQKMSDKPIRKCPSCEARKVERLVSVTSFQLKGGGWYADGYTSSQKKNGATSGSGKAADSKSGDGASASSSTKAGKASKGGKEKAAASAAA